jgi:hypothetical protein
MKLFIKATFIIFGVFTLAACGVKDVQPIMALSDVSVGKLQVSNFNVVLSPQYESRLKQNIESQEVKLADNQKRLAKLNENKNGSKDKKQYRRKEVNKYEKRIVRLNEEMITIPKDVQTGLETALVGLPQGTQSVNVDVEINSFTLTDTGMVLLAGGSDSMNATMNIKDATSNENIGVYSVTDSDQNAAGGILGLMVRGGDARGDMIRQFSEKVLAVIYGVDVVKQNAKANKAATRRTKTD